jgi:large subunit ribosomal protein L30
MTIAEKKTAKPKAAKPASPKVEAKKPAVKKEITGAKVKVTQVQGSIARKWDQEATLIGLGLNKRHRARVLPDNACTRGMINKVRHLVVVEKVG